VRKRIETLFGRCRPRAARPVPDGPLQDVPEQRVASCPCTGANARERAALRVAAVAWEAELRKHGQAHVEAAPDGTLRAAFRGADPAPLRQTRTALHQPLPDDAFRRARTQAGTKAQMYRRFFTSYGDPQKAKDVKTATRTMLQSAIDRLRFEAEGGAEFVKLLESLTREDVAAAAAKYLTDGTEQMRSVKP
jgi:hypothetical protein